MTARRKPAPVSDRQRLALSVLSRYGGKYSAAFVGGHLNPSARMSHLAASSTLISLETKGLARRELSTSISDSTYLWSITPKGRKVLRAAEVKP